ncbi:hypothetical protein KJ751_02115, partial [Patescibacteria group bacterium]|nr:hypothetical protein [Patescibacteria group bacterium]
MKKIVFLLAVFIFLSSGIIVFAQQEGESVFEGEGIFIEINIRNAVITAQDKNKFDISFDITNGAGIQSGVKYGIQLMKGNTVVDEKVYEEVLSFQENEAVTKKIEYEAPGFLVGEYDVWVVAKNNAGLFLAMQNIGMVSFWGTDFYLEIEGSTCYLQVEGEKLGVKYTPLQGVDISSDEDIIAKCKIKNHFNIPIKFRPLFETYRRSTFGEKISAPSLPGNEGEVSIDGDEEKEISFVLPRANVPQAYDVKLFLAGSVDGKIISNFAVFHYVLRGSSATVQNIQLDKDYYSKGDIAKVSFFWTSSADSFPGTRAQAGTILSSVVLEGVIEGCSEKFFHTPSDADAQLITVTVDVPITKKCENPEVKLSIKSGAGLLDEANFNIKSGERSEYTLLIVILAFIILAGLIIFGRRKKTTVPLMLLLFLVVGMSFFIPRGDVSADAVSWGIPNTGGRWGAFYTFSVNVSSNPISVNFSGVNSGSCSNIDLAGHIKVYHDGTYVGITNQSFAKSTVPGTHYVRLDFVLVNFAFGLDDCFDSEYLGRGSVCPASCDLSYGYGDEWVSYCWCHNLKISATNPLCSQITNPGAQCALANSGTSPWCTIPSVVLGSKTYTYVVAEAPAPTCTMSVTPSQGVLPGSQVNFTWTSSGATSASYSCTSLLGSIKGDMPYLNYTNYPMTASTTAVTGDQGGCSIIFSNDSGKTKTCSANFTVKQVDKPSCNLAFSPSSITAPGSSMATWNSRNATQLKYDCAGVKTMSGPWGS